MNRTIIGLAVALATAMPAFAQTIDHRMASDGVITQPTTADDLTVRLQDLARRTDAAHETAARVALIDVAWPRDAAEFRAVGGSVIVVVSAATHDPAELPLARVYLRIGGREVALRRIASRSSVAEPESLVARTVGAYREDDVYLAPGRLMAGQGTVQVDFKVNRTGFDLSALPMPPPPALKALVAGRTPPVEGGAVAAMLIREYPGVRWTPD